VRNAAICAGQAFLLLCKRKDAVIAQIVFVLGAVDAAAIIV
jgi:hypothetical protein